MSKITNLEKRRTTAAAEAETASRRMPVNKEAPQSDPTEVIERTTITIPITLLEAVDARLARLGRRQRVSFSGYIEAALKELLARGEEDLEILDRHSITKRRGNGCLDLTPFRPFGFDP
jgi:hypothetical protein